MVSRNTRISSTVTTDITPSGYIMMPPFARISRKFISLTAGAEASVAAETVSAERKNPAADKWQHFMNKWESIDLCRERKRQRDVGTGYVPDSGILPNLSAQPQKASNPVAAPGATTRGKE